METLLGGLAFMLLMAAQVLAVVSCSTSNALGGGQLGERARERQALDAVRLVEHDDTEIAAVLDRGLVS